MQKATWYIALFGGLRVTRGERTLEQLRSQKAGALLAYLSLFPHRAHTREELADRFWPDADVETGRGSLRTALAALRREIEDGEDGADENAAPLLSRGKGDVHLVPGRFTTDVAEFERAVAQSLHPAATPEEQMRRLMAAAELYRGPLLPGLYDAWALGERDRLAELHQALLSRLSQHHERAGAWADALAWARRRAAADPLSEAAHAEIIRLLMATGQTAAARRHFDDSERLLETAGMEPSAQMRAALDAPDAGSLLTELPRAERVSAPPLTHSSPPLPGAGGLPLTLTPFFGRETETAQLRTLLENGARLVTLTGTGGAGKTRLAVEVARHVRSHFSGGVYFAALTELPDAARLWDVIAEALDLPPSPGIHPLDQIVLALTSGEAPRLLVLDNFEHLVDDGAALVYSLLERVPSLTCLVTSRRRLLLGGEQEFTVAPLPTPGHPGTPERLWEFPSVQLWVSRARAARPDFELTEQNATSVAALCARLEGLPLAIELAAAWANTLTPAEMEERLTLTDGGLRSDLLVSRRRDAPDRHATLQSAMEWSWSLLPPNLQAFFAGLSVFRGGWTLKAAEGVTGEARALEFTAQLCERSLIVAEESKAFRREEEPDTPGPTMRYRMLESLREFATHQLAPSDKARLTTRHLRYFQQLAEEAEPHLAGPEQVTHLRRLERDHDNLRAALEAAANDNSDSRVPYLNLTRALISFWIRHGQVREGLSHVQRALEGEAGTQELLKARAALLPGAGWLAWCLADPGGRTLAQTWSEEAVVRCRAYGDHRGEALSLATLALAAHHRSDPEQALDRIEEAVRIARDVGEPWLLGHCLRVVGSILFSRGQTEQASQVLSESVALLRESGDRYAVAVALRSLAMTVAARDDRTTARQHIRESIALYDQLGETSAVAHSTIVLGYITSDDGDPVEACRHFDLAVRLCREAGNQYGMAHALHNRAHARLTQRQYDAARADFQDSLRRFRDLENRGDILLSLEGIAALAAAQQHWKRATLLLAAAEIERGALGAPLYSNDLIRHNAHVQAARSALGASFDAHWAEGAALTLEQGIACALE